MASPHIKDLPPELVAKLGLGDYLDKPKRNNTFSMEAVRQNSIRVMACLGKLTQSQRTRVLKHALKINEV